MPELPEIETLKNEIISFGLVGKKIIEINVNDRKAINMEANKFKEFIIGKRIINVERKGKNLILLLSHKDFIIIHLRLFGKMRVSKSSLPSQLNFAFDNGLWLCLSQLAFGAGAHLFQEAQLKDILKQGKDALTISLNDFKKLLKKGMIKPLLMDQKKIAGIGNTYADEILFLAKINPEREASSLKDNEISAIHKAIFNVLQEAIKAGGVTLEDFVHLDGSSGEFACRVHNQEGKPCPFCGTIIRKIKLKGRGTFFCSNCQV